MGDNEVNNIRRCSTSTAREEYQALLSAAATTAGTDNWKTCAGRLDGPDGFIPSDLYNCMKRSFRRQVKGLKQRTRCPVCMDDPSLDSENGWYITKSCNHAVCRDCLKSYASSQISDPNHSGPLKCPCCPRLLRVEDAKAALSDSAYDDFLNGKNRQKNNIDSPLFTVSEEDKLNNALTVLKKWDGKVRDDFLRSMTDFRPCPHCSKNQEDSSTDLNGGGFVTPECLSPINEEREAYAEQIIRFAGPKTAQAILFGYAIYYMFCSQSFSETTSRAAITIQIITALLPGILVPVLPHMIRLYLAKIAKEAIVKPIIVTCPCCDTEFNLEASSEFNLAETSSNSSSESATQNWKNNNTRPCPGCSSPILKDGGCNHVKCGKCRVNFCWACMRIKSQCKAYQCKNGAPYGNAFGDGSLAAVVAGLAAGEREARTLMEHIEAIESEARRNLQGSIITRNGAKLIGMYAISSLFVDRLWFSDVSSSPVVYFLVKCVFAAFVLILGCMCLAGLGIFFSVLLRLLSHDVRQQRTVQPYVANEQRETTSRVERLRDRISRTARLNMLTEEEMIAEAIARSIDEQ